MKTKLAAAELSTGAGCHCVIVNSQNPERIIDVLENNENMQVTVFLAKKCPLDDRKWWIKHLKPKGQVIIDNGAVAAILKHHSLLPSGIKGIQGSNFLSHSCVEIVSLDGKVIGKGIVNYSQNEIDRLKSRKTNEIYDILGYCDSDCIIHRDNIICDSI
jgi:glutamate 5-kinase